VSRKQKLTRDEHISLGRRFVQIERRLFDLAKEISAAYPLSSRQIKKVWRTIDLLTETRMAMDYAASTEFRDLSGAYLNNSDLNKEQQQMDTIVTDAAIELGQDLDGQIWAGFLIDGEMRWVENYDEEVDYYPGHKPLIICHATEMPDHPNRLGPDTP
jgi:class 3 adenylate cyclase